MVDSRQILADYALFAAMLVGSTVGHFALAVTQQEKRTIHVELHDREYGRTSVAVTLVAAKPKAAEPIQELIKDLKKPVETPEKEAQIKPRDLPIARRPPAEEIVSALQARPNTPPVPQMTTVETEPSEVKRDELPPPTKELPKPLPKKTADVKLPELETIEFESSVTVVTKQSSGIDVPPKVLTRPDPLYPADLVRRRVEGQLQLSVTIGPDGTPRSVSVLESSGYEAMDEAALAAVRRWKFSPAMREGEAVEHEVIVPISFSIRKRS